MRVRPLEGLKVRHPQTREVLPPDGIFVPDDDLYWSRRIRQGDVEVVPESPVEGAQP